MEAVVGGDETDHPAHEGSVSASEEERLAEGEQQLGEFLGGTAWGQAYFCLNFLRLKRRKGTRCTIRYILATDRLPVTNCCSALRLQDTPAWKGWQVVASQGSLASALTSSTAAPDIVDILYLPRQNSNHHHPR